MLGMYRFEVPNVLLEFHDMGCQCPSREWQDRSPTEKGGGMINARILNEVRKVIRWKRAEARSHAESSGRTLGLLNCRTDSL